ncbi:putative membrane protein [Acinetobacter johnsonii]|uniref:Uncharacterized protein n=1 Tax=Acinetobacter johnsonii TaxID=40214 RepID=A0A239RUF6_ACIJO|nr:hypothetical protein [Acinetobacter johnsonii]RSE17253.1 hypothetical protein EGT73_17365 [Acinetobacter johnsonii]SNU13556.1 putative membrane protein [Acinetobacter johnsonii]
MAGNKRVAVGARNGKGDELQVHHQESDSPIVYTNELEKLHTFRPDLVDWVVKMTTDEAEERRKQTSRTNKFIFAERVLGQFFAGGIGLCGIVGGGYVALNGAAAAGATIASVTIGTLAVSFIFKK